MNIQSIHDGPTKMKENSEPLTNHQKTVIQSLGLNPETLGWHDKVPTEPQRRVIVARRRSFIEWLSYRYDDLVGMALTSFLGGCGLIFLAFGVVVVYGIYKFIQYLFG